MLTAEHSPSSAARTDVPRRATPQLIGRAVTTPRGPLIPLLGQEGGALVRAFVQPGAGEARADGLRAEIAPLLDVGLYGSGLAAIAQFEAHPLPRHRLSLFPRRSAFRLGVQGQDDVGVAEDRSADLGLALALYGWAAGKDLSHVVATGSLRRTRAEAPDARSGAVFPVAGLERKLGLAAAAAWPGGGPVQFLYPKENTTGEFQDRVEATQAAATARGSAIDVLPVASVEDALASLRISRQQLTPAGRVVFATGAPMLLLAALGLGWRAYEARPLPLAWAAISSPTGEMATPIRIRSSGSARPELCRFEEGFDRLPLARTGERVAFAIKGEAEPGASAIVAVSEQTGPRVHPTPQVANRLGFEISVAPPAEYTRVAFVARRQGAIDLEALTKAVRTAYDAAGAGDGGVQAVANFLQSRFPGYVGFGFRATEDELPCRH